MSREMKNSGIEWIGQIPQHWIALPNKYLMKKLKMILSRYNDEPILSLTMDGVIVRDLDAGGKMPTSFDGYQKISKGNLLMCLFDIDVTPRCIGLIKQDGVTSPAYSQFVLNAGNYAPYYYYLYLYLDNDKLLLPLAKNLRHSLTEDVLGEIPMIQPPLSEQQSIANYLDFKCSQIDQLSDNIKQQIEELGEYKKALITQAVTKGLDPDVEMKDSGIKWVGNIPQKWEVSPLYVCFKERKNKNKEEQENNLLSLSYGKIVRKPIDILEGLLPESFSTYNIVEKGDIIIRPTDLQNDKKSLRTGLVQEHGIITSAYIDLYLTGIGDVRYYHYLLHAFDEAKVFYNMGNGVRQGLNYSTFSKLPILTPSLEDQSNIADYLNSKCSLIDALVQTKNEKLDTLQDYKKSLVFDYVTGKKEVPADFRKE